MPGLDAFALTLDLRTLLRLVVLSGVLALVAPLLFRRNAPSRRQFLLWAAALLLVLPWLAAWFNLALPVGVLTQPSWSLEQALPLWLVLPFAAISLLGLLRVVVLAREQRRALMLLPQVEDPRLYKIAQGLLQPLGLLHMPRFRLAQADSALPAAPFACSKAGGQVVLPQDYPGLDDHRLRAVLTHEFVHLARRDDWGCLVMRALVSAYWFLPWLRKMERDYLAAMEHSCDDRAADFFGPSLSYMEGVVGAVGGSMPTSFTHVARREVDFAVPSPVHPLLQRVLRFGHRREFDADTARVAGYLLLTLTAGLTLASLQPVQQTPGIIASAGLAFPTAPLPSVAPSTQAPKVQVSIAEPLPQNQRAKRVHLAHHLVALEQPLPVYPGNALRADLEGEVWVDYQIAMDGSVVKPQIAYSVPPGLFEHSALTTVRRTRYRHLSHYTAPLNFSPAGPAARELRVRQRFRYQLQASR